MPIPKNRVNKAGLAASFQKIGDSRKKGRTKQQRSVTKKDTPLQELPPGNANEKPIFQRTAKHVYTEKLIKFIHYITEKLRPDRLITLIKEMVVAAEARTYGTRYTKGIPPEELKNLINPGILLVRGPRVNPFLHSLVYFSDENNKNPRFCQINDLKNYPEFMNQEEFGEYLKDLGAGGHVCYVYQPPGTSKIPQSYEKGGGVPDLKGMHEYLNNAAKRKWLWGGFAHNCFTFSRKVLEAAGCDTSELKHVIDLPKPVIEQQLNAKEKPKAHMRFQKADIGLPEETPPNQDSN